MPWFPDFVSAVELARKQTRAEGRADPVAHFFTALNAGDAQALETAWPGEVVVYDPRAGVVRSRRELRKFVHSNQEWQARRHARIKTVASTRSGERAVVELVAYLDDADPWPVTVVAEASGDESVVFRTYCSQRPLDGRHHLRPAILDTRAGLPADVGRYQAALATGDTEALVRGFAPDGYVQEPDGAKHTGAAELREFYTGIGAVRLEPCAITDGGDRCALEYTCDRFGGHDVAAQAGICVFDRTGSGLFSAVRVYDDVDLPT
ncbi:nuclear transport factor 2 family protein [Amycolatopsis sp. NPDC051903]|uniref:nuclear transport factor 2 family protein n=1 Tax=Amycolatopsis sp. NPDC051903 TaxID=3363936 RepID=UPI00379C8029